MMKQDYQMAIVFMETMPTSNDTFMMVPYPMISSGPKDAYNFIIHRSGLILSVLSEFWSTSGASSRRHLVQRYLLWFVVFASCIISALIEEAQHHQNDMHMTI